MKTLSLLLLLLPLVLASGCQSKKTNDKAQASVKIAEVNDTTIVGRWKRISPIGALIVHFKEDGTIETDFGADATVDLISTYTLLSDTIVINDQEGKACPDAGIYKINNQGYTLSFDLQDDLCNNRIKAMSGYWVRLNYLEQIKALSSHIDKTKKLNDILHRGRMYLALGEAKLARNDFDTYLKRDSSLAKVFVNRASTRFPHGLHAVVVDCSKAIALDATDKYAFFLRGLAYYGLGEKQKGCDDFRTAIDLGFEILEEAEAYKCKGYW
ncbi:hypothetical protein J1N10_12450 [Carboxylicivirga sp. A043]|uniref:tetratricopeptide repeat protein n=1 Tax=Carboxylicivirga litoralis TaxID=2816963 RepID=UPI0021CB756C|nr:hypothetical protein [Carboxylicivirga sp. A043]MCU4156792.1 hypothetical protein [Carboxylicivirga sp. A043]